MAILTRRAHRTLNLAPRASTSLPGPAKGKCTRRQQTCWTDLEVREKKLAAAVGSGSFLQPDCSLAIVALYSVRSTVPALQQCLTPRRIFAFSAPYVHTYILRTQVRLRQCRTARFFPLCVSFMTGNAALLSSILAILVLQAHHMLFGHPDSFSRARQGIVPVPHSPVMSSPTQETHCSHSLLHSRQSDVTGEQSQVAPKMSQVSPALTLSCLSNLASPALTLVSSFPPLTFSKAVNDFRRHELFGRPISTARKRLCKLPVQAGVACRALAASVAPHVQFLPLNFVPESEFTLPLIRRGSAVGLCLSLSSCGLATQLTALFHHATSHETQISCPPATPPLDASLHLDR